MRLMLKALSPATRPSDPKVCLSEYISSAGTPARFRSGCQTYRAKFDGWNGLPTVLGNTSPWPLPRPRCALNSLNPGMNPYGRGEQNPAVHSKGETFHGEPHSPGRVGSPGE